MGLTAAQTATQMADTVRNPVINAKAGQTVHIALRMNGVAFDPNAFYAALDSLYATVASDKDTVDRGDYQFVVSP